MSVVVRVVDSQTLHSHAAVVAEAFAAEPDPEAIVRCVDVDVAGRSTIRFAAERNGRTVGIAVAGLQGKSAFLDLIAVSPDVHGMGVGRSLLESFEDSLGGRGAEEFRVGNSTLGYVWPGVSNRRSAALAMLIRHGYTRTDVATDLGVDVTRPFVGDGAVERLAAHGVTIRRGTPDDLASARAYIESTFTVTWANEVEYGLTRPGASVWFAERGGQIVGFVAVGVFRQHVLGPIATDPKLQGGGVGGELLRRGLTDLHAAGVRHVRIGWSAESAFPFYSRTVGASCVDTFWMFTKKNGEMQ
ncbi:GNAT family N-acetyltransferase [Amnibacterium sp. CER49]|uniref:GNAT family N-acetyltransferase n=1 Tax=Amnibacterium sp. CER49 TaxID=3039161 RepID=UPI00244B8316|nr:GNAT family N-acetyltransferase [Amnibacterium sp. CER49]MDH2442565.1 GNAT family N-acetyltransferase [Amnibacterium sp. CER49]